MTLTALSADELQAWGKENLPPGIVESPPEPPEPAKKKICVGLLSYDGRMEVKTHLALSQAVFQCAKMNWGFSYILREADSMVARGRSFIASQFLENPASKDATDLVFIDLDLSWDGDEFVRLCSHDVDVVGGAYPYKDESGDFPLRWPSDGLMEQNGLWEVQATTPGFFRVSRRALQKIANEMPHLEFKDRGNPEGHRSWMFFDNLHRPSGIFDEGYVFCERWRQCGGKVYLDPDLNFAHIGKKGFRHGSIRDWLARKSETFEKLESEYPGVPPLKLMQRAMGSKEPIVRDGDEVFGPLLKAA